MKKKIHLILGILFWGVVVTCALVTARPRQGETTSDHISLVRYFAGPSESLEVQDATLRLRRHDPVFFQEPGGNWRQVGHVSRGHGGSSAETIQLDWYAPDVSPQQCQLTFYRNTGRLEEVVATMLPPHKRRQIQDRLAKVMTAHGEELSAAFVPLVQKTLQQSLPVIEDEFRSATDRHRGDIDHLAERWNNEVVSKRLIPLARREILPVVREHGEPVAEKIGKELWDRASIWRFGWRAVYDKTPLPQRNLVQGEWDRFVEREAVPVFEAHMDDIVVVVQRILTDVAANQKVRHELADVADSLSTDPEARRLVRKILQETLIENQRLRSVWTQVWTSDEAQRALQMAGDRLEPVVRQIGDDLFGTQETGINPDFARVLRNQILGKDRQWIVATLSQQTSSQAIRLADATMPYPIVYMADRAAGDEGGSP